MSNEMIERVANAIRDSFNSNDIDCYPIAKAAIEAMREPTEAMVEAAFGKSDLSPHPFGLAWRDMIDAALKDG